MSEENVEAFKLGIEAANRRDIEALLAELDPEVEWHARLPMAGGDAVYQGHEGVRAFLQDMWETLADTKFRFPEILDAGDQVVGLGRFSARGEMSGIETGTPFAYVVEYRHGKARRVRAFLDHDEALEAAGLSE
jgi:uncharacterized protein